MHPNTEKLLTRFYEYIEEEKVNLDECFKGVDKTLVYAVLLNFYLDGANTALQNVASDMMGKK